MRRRVVIFTPCYLPGYKAGGPIRTVKSICDNYKTRADIYIVTVNHDENLDNVYLGITPNEWINQDGVWVMYADEANFGYKLFRKIYSEFDTIYACGLFAKCTYQLLAINRLHYLKGKRLYIAPMGVFGDNAIKRKWVKKKLFLYTFSALGMFRNILWSFTSDDEYEDAKKQIKSYFVKDFIIAEDIPSYPIYSSEDFDTSIKASILKVISLSRIMPIKNTKECFEILSGIKDIEVQFDVYGIIEDNDYWNECQELSKKLPDNIRYSYKGEAQPSKVISLFHDYDIFLFPTVGENYGHVIYEALAGGCIPVISDTTIWKDIEAEKAGAIVQFGNIDGYRKAIHNFANLCLNDTEKFCEYKKNAINYAIRKYRDSIKESGYDIVFVGENCEEKKSASSQLSLRNM